MNERYLEIIDLPHHVSKRHPQMSKHDRAAQFAPYSALSGYEDAVEETGRRTDQKIELDEGEKEIINMRLTSAIGSSESVSLQITYFVPDERKEGGSYLTVKGKIGKFDEIKREITLTCGRVIPTKEIISVEEIKNESKE